MRTVITISLNGNAYQLDAVGYDALRAYLQVAEQRLAGNPDQAEILADLEQAIADKCHRYLGPHKNVVSADEVSEVIREMGPVDGGAGEAAAQAGGPGGLGAGAGPDVRDGVGAGVAGGMGARADGGVGAGAGRTYTADEYAEAVGETWTADGSGVGGTGTGSATGAGSEQGARAGYAGATTPPGAAAAPGVAPRRLYQIREGAAISGVCQGLAAYLNLDVSIVRLLFVVLAIVTGGVWILVYIVMMFVIPFAQTSEQHAAAHGWPFNAEELINRAKTHYAAFKESEKWRRRQWREERRMWNDQRKQWKQERKDWERSGAYGAPPPPPPPWSGASPAGANPANMSYSSQVMHGALSPLVELVGALLFIAFLFALFSLATKHRIFGWGMPGDVPWWVGVLVLIVLYRAIVAPLRQARYAAYYGPNYGQGILALVGVLIWLTVVSFCVWLAWHHWAEVQAFFQQLFSNIREFIDDRPRPADHAQALLLPMLPGVPTRLLPFRARAGELQSHG
jgi:phage shock protein PspC (stress-responsive transcriptional regulator)